MGQNYPQKVINDFKARAKAMGYDPDHAELELRERLHDDVNTPIAQIVRKLLAEMERRKG